MTRAILAICLGLLGSAQTTLPPQPARDPSAIASVGTAVLAGRVVSDDGSSRPMRRATVNLNGANLRGGRVAMTDDQGRFVFTALPPGQFTVSASKPAYLTANYNTTGIRGAQTRVTLAAGQQESVTLQMSHGAAITGIVRDTNGQPLSGVRVVASLLRQQAGQRTVASSRSSSLSSDERGVYRIYGLAPGDYLVAAASPTTTPSPTVTDEEVQWARQQAAMSAGRGGVSTPPPPPGPTFGTTSVYYPGTTMASAAVTVTLTTGEERTGIDFPLPTVPLAKLEGVLIDPSGRPPAPASITLVVPDALGNGASLPAGYPTSARSGADGKFTFQRLPPGRYLLQVRVAGRPAGSPIATVPAPTDLFFRAIPPPTGAAPAPAQREMAVTPAATPTLWASVEVSMNGSDVSNIGITLQPGLKISGRIAFDGTMAPPSDLSRARVTMSPIASSSFSTSVPSAQVAPDGAFTIDGATPGRYRLTASIPGAMPQGLTLPGTQMSTSIASAPNPSGAMPSSSIAMWSLKSVTVNGRDILDFPLEIERSDIGGLVATFADRQTEINGTLFNAAGAPATDYSVLLFSVDRTFWAAPSRRVRSVRPNTDGRFRAAGLPPGEYFMMALADGSDIDWTDPAFLDQLSQAAFKITLADGEKKTQDLKLAR